MTKHLQDAFAEASKLRDEEQDRLAAWLLSELASERLWDRAFAASRTRLAELAAEALDEYRARYR